MPGGHGRVRGENKSGGRGFLRLVVGQVVRRHQTADVLQAQERRVALVHMVDGRLDAHSLQRAITADAQQDFLADAEVLIAAVQLVRDVAILRARVLRDVGIEQIERRAPHVGPPDARVDRAAGEIDADREWRAVRRADRVQGEIIEVIVLVRLLLPSGLIEVLAEVTLLVEQAHADQGNAQVAGGLDVIAGEDAQPTGEDGETFRDAKLEREIGDQRIAGFAVRAREPGRLLLVEVVLEVLRDPVQVRQEADVVGDSLQPFLVDGAQHQDRIVVRSSPINRCPTVKRVR